MTVPYITGQGGRTADELFGEGGRERMERNAERWVERADESWARIHTDYVMNGMYSRGVLPTSVRELCAVAALTALGRFEELGPHIRFALRMRTCARTGNERRSESYIGARTSLLNRS